MLSQLSLRNALHALFRHQRAAAVVALLPIAIFFVAVLPKPSEFESAGSLIVKVLEQDGVSPDLISEQQGRSAASASNMAKQIISSNQLIISSEDVRKRALLRVGVLKVYPALAKKAPSLQLELGIEQLGKDFSAKVSGETSILALSLFNRDPVVAQQTLNAIIDAAIEKQASVMHDPRTQFLDRRLQAVRRELDAAQRALMTFKQQSHITSFDEERTLLLKQRDEVESSLSGLRAQLAAAEGRSRTLQTSLGSTNQLMVTSDENDAMHAQLDVAHERVEAARARLAQTAARSGTSGVEYADQSRDLTEAQRQYDAMREQSRLRARKSVNPLGERIAADLTNARSDATASVRAVAERQQQLDAINERIGVLDGMEVKLSELERRRTLAEHEYEAYLQRAQSARIVGEMNEAGITNMSVLQQPTLATRPARPKKLMLFVMSILAGLLCSIGACVLLEMIDDRPSLPEDIERLLKLPVLTSITLKTERRRDA